MPARFRLTRLKLSWFHVGSVRSAVIQLQTKMRLYNEYNALTDEGNKLFFKAVKFCSKFAKDCEAQGVDLRDAHGVLMNAAGMGFSDTILQKAFLMKKAERSRTVAQSFLSTCQSEQEEKKSHP
jgi:hypothetical protein